MNCRQCSNRVGRFSFVFFGQYRHCITPDYVLLKTPHRFDRLLYFFLFFLYIWPLSFNSCSESRRLSSVHTAESNQSPYISGDGLLLRFRIIQKFGRQKRRCSTGGGAHTYSRILPTRRAVYRQQRFARYPRNTSDRTHVSQYIVMHDTLKRCSCDTRHEMKFYPRYVFQIVVSKILLLPRRPSRY